MGKTEPRPDGIEAEHARVLGRRGHANPLGLVLLAMVIAGAMLGFAGSEVDRSASANGVTLSWHAPERIRNGEFLEMRIVVEATDAIDRLVVGVDAALWEDLTVNTLIPAAAEEASKDGEFLFDFGALPPAQSFLIKIDAQINPDALGGNAGTLTAYDGDRPLVELPLHMDVLP